MIRALVSAALGLLAAGCAVSAPAKSPASLEARPTARAGTDLPAGVSRLTGSAFVFRPREVADGAGLLVLLHGAGGDARRFLEHFKAQADRGGFLLLSLQSSAATWDVIAQQGDPREQGFGADIAAADTALATLFRRASIDPRRVVLGGFSDGASYALSVGLANPQLFAGVLAMSPGFLVPPTAFAAGQRVFITHGRSDRVLPFGNAARLADALNAAGVVQRFHPFDGGHAIDRSALDAGIRFTMNSAGT